jgi:hypothetical protein
MQAIEGAFPPLGDRMNAGRPMMTIPVSISCVRACVGTRSKNHRPTRATATMAATNKSLAKNNKSCTGGKTTKDRAPAGSTTTSMKLITKIRFTKPHIAFLMRAYPNCNLDRLTTARSGK